MSFQKVINQLGEYKGIVGSGILWPYWQLNDGSCVTLYFGRDSSGEFLDVFHITITDIKGRVYELKQPQE